MDDPAFARTVLAGARDPNTKFTVALDGLSGSGTRTQVTSAIERGQAEGLGGGLTNWGLATLSQHGRLRDVNFVRGGRRVDNPFSDGG